MTYFVINVPWPESSQGSIIRLLRQDGVVVLPCLINVFKDHKGLSQWSSIVDKHRYLLVNRVVFDKKITLVPKIFFKVSVLDSLQFQGNLHPSGKRASPHTKQLNFSVVFGHCKLLYNYECGLRFYMVSVLLMESVARKVGYHHPWKVEHWVKSHLN